MTGCATRSLGLEEAGFRVMPWRVSRKSLNPLREFYSFLQVLRAYWKERPDLVHHIALKPTVYGAFAARLCGGIPTINTVTGLGPVFARTDVTMRTLRALVAALLRLSFRPSRCRVVFQNQDDLNLLVESGIAPAEKSVVILGFGVDTEQFAPGPEPEGEFVVLLPGRMLWEKGVREFVDAAKELRERGLKVRMVLVGAPDGDNPGCIPEPQLREWAESGIVEWWGHRDDMPAVLRQAHIICLPSYREGMPKVLLEAAACGKAVVTTDAPGCSYVVKQGVNGLLVPVRDSGALADAIQELLQNAELRLQMGAKGRVRAVEEFSEEPITRLVLNEYEKVLQGKWGRTGKAVGESVLEGDRGYVHTRASREIED